MWYYIYIAKGENNMQQEYENLNPLRIIRIAKDLNKGDFAKYFLCTTAYISALEQDKCV